LRPESDAAHIEKTIDLLLSLKPEDKIINKRNETKAKLVEVFPNPFTSQTTIKYALTDDGNVSFQVFDGTGKAISSEVLGNVPKGNHQFILDLSKVLPGTYFLVLRIDGIDADLEKIIVK